MSNDKKSGEDADYFEDDKFEILLVPERDSPLKATPNKRSNRQDTPSKSRYKSPKVYRNNLNGPKIPSNSLKPILGNGETLHNQTVTNSARRLSMSFKSPGSSSSSYSTRINTRLYNKPTKISNSPENNGTTSKKAKLISKMKTKAESNKFCPIYDIDKIMVGQKLLKDEDMKDFTQLKYINDEFHMVRATNSNHDDDSDVIIKQTTISELFIQRENQPMICMALKRVPKNFPCGKEVRVHSPVPSMRRIIFYLPKNTDISSGEIDKFKEIFNKCWNTVNISQLIFDSINSSEVTRHTSPGSPTHHDSVISEFVENGDHIDIESNQSVSGSQLNEVIVEINSSPPYKPNESNSSKHNSEGDVDVENSTQASTPNETSSDVKNTQLRSPASNLAIVDKTPSKLDNNTSIYDPNSINLTPPPNRSSSLFTPRRSSRILGRPVSPDFNSEITHWIAEMSSSDNVLTYRLPNNKSITIHGDDLQRLKSGIFLNDTLIEFYSQWLLVNYNDEDPELSDKVYIANPFFYTFIQKGNFERARKWISKVDLFNKKYVFIPINENLHWYLALICNLPSYNPLKDEPKPRDPQPSDPIIFIFDSLKLKHPKTFEQLELFLYEEYKFRYPEKNKEAKANEREGEGVIYNPKLTIHTYVKVRGQDNFSDCGVYLLFYLKHILSDPKERKGRLLKDRTIDCGELEGDMKAMRREIVNTIYKLTKEDQGYHGLLSLIDDFDNNPFKSEKSINNYDDDDDGEDIIIED